MRSSMLKQIEDLLVTSMKIKIYDLCVAVTESTVSFSFSLLNFKSSTQFVQIFFLSCEH